MTLPPASRWRSTGEPPALRLLRHFSRAGDVGIQPGAGPRARPSRTRATSWRCRWPGPARKSTASWRQRLASSACGGAGCAAMNCCHAARCLIPTSVETRSRRGAVTDRASASRAASRQLSPEDAPRPAAATHRGLLRFFRRAPVCMSDNRTLALGIGHIDNFRPMRSDQARDDSIHIVARQRPAGALRRLERPRHSRASAKRSRSSQPRKRSLLPSRAGQLSSADASRKTARGAAG